MMGHLEWLTALADQLDRLHDVTVESSTILNSGDARSDSAEAIAAALRRRKIVRER